MKLELSELEVWCLLVAQFGFRAGQIHDGFLARDTMRNIHKAYLTLSNPPQGERIESLEVELSESDLWHLALYTDPQMRIGQADTGKSILLKVIAALQDDDDHVQLSDVMERTLQEVTHATGRDPDQSTDEGPEPYAFT